MRWHVLRPLLHKEALRHAANRGGIALIVLLLGASMLLSFFGGKEGPAAGLAPGLQLCYVDHEDGALVSHLRGAVPAELVPHVRFRRLANAPRDAAGTVVYPHNAGAVQLRRGPYGEGVSVWFWHPGNDPGALAPYEAWFWKEAYRHAQKQQASYPVPEGRGPAASLLDDQRSAFKGGFDARSGIATSLVMFGLFFVCVYLLPSLTCEERERGVLLAQALSPASAVEILAAKFLFYPVFALALAAALAGTYEPRVLLRPFFWMGMLACVVGSMGIGLTIASLAKTQRTASMGAMCYTLAVALILFICQQNGLPGLPYLALEYHTPRILHAALTDSVLWYHWGNLAGASLLAVGWCIAACVLFRRCGWQ